MRKLRILSCARQVIVCLALGFCVVHAQTTQFSYQGSLKDGANPANGNYDFEFALFDAASGGSQVGPTNSRNGVAVSNGTFSVALDFGNVFPGAARYIEVRVRQGAVGPFTVLMPRQLVLSTPYSINSLNSLQLGGIPADGFVQNRSSQQLPQPLTNFNISGDGTLGGTLTVQTNQDYGVLAITTASAPGEIPVVAGFFESSTGSGRTFGVEGKVRSPSGIAGVFINTAGGDVIKGSSIGDTVFLIDGFGNMDLAGKARIGTLGASGGTDPLCRNDNFEIATCGSAFRDMREITKYSGGLRLITKLQPITFRSGPGGPLNLGLNFDKAAEVAPLLTVTNQKGEIEGVKYDRVGVVLVNAVNEQQKIIEDLQRQITELKKLLCMSNKQAEICREEPK